MKEDIFVPFFTTEVESQGQRWLSAVFSSAWLRGLNQTDLNTTQHFLSLNLSLRRWANTASDKMPSRLGPYMATVRHITGAFIALLSPVPGLEGCCLDDVDLIFSNSRKPRVVDDFPRIGQVIATKLRGRNDSGEFWRDMISKFKQHQGAEVAYGPSLRNTAEKLQNVADSGEQFDAATWSEIVSTLEHLPTWRDELRVGATRGLETSLVSVLEQDVVAVQAAHEQGTESTDDALQILGDLKGILKRVEEKQGRTLMQRICASITDWSIALQKVDLDQKVLAVIAEPTPALVTELGHILKANPDQSMDLRNAWQGGVLRFTEWVAGNPDAASACDFQMVANLLRWASKPELQPYVDLSQKLGDLQVACNGTGGGKAQISKISGLFAPAKVELKKHGKAQGTLMNYQATIHVVYDTCRQQYLDMTVEIVTKTSLQLQKFTIALAKIAGGSNDGSKWFEPHATADEFDVLQCYNETLAKANRVTIEKSMHSLSRFNDVLLRYNDVITSSF